MSKANKALAFLENMNMAADEAPTAPAAPVKAETKASVATPAETSEVTKQPKAKAKPVAGGRGTHIGGYLDDKTCEKFALLKIRLKMDNSELIAEAVCELYKKQEAKKAFER